MFHDVSPITLPLKENEHYSYFLSVEMVWIMLQSNVIFIKNYIDKIALMFNWDYNQSISRDIGKSKNFFYQLQL